MIAIDRVPEMICLTRRSAKDADGNTPLTLARSRGYGDMAALLQKAGDRLEVRAAAEKSKRLGQ